MDNPWNHEEKNVALNFRSIILSDQRVQVTWNVVAKQRVLDPPCSLSEVSPDDNDKAQI